MKNKQNRTVNSSSKATFYFPSPIPVFSIWDPIWTPVRFLRCPIHHFVHRVKKGKLLCFKIFWDSGTSQSLTVIVLFIHISFIITNIFMLNIFAIYLFPVFWVLSRLLLKNSVNRHRDGADSQSYWDREREREVHTATLQCLMFSFLPYYKLCNFQFPVLLFFNIPKTS